MLRDCGRQLWAFIGTLRQTMGGARPRRSRDTAIEAGVGYRNLKPK